MIEPELQHKEIMPFFYRPEECGGIGCREIELYRKLKRSLINEVAPGKRPVFADKSLRRGKEVA